MQTKIFVICLQILQLDTILKSEFTSFNKNASYCKHDQLDIEFDNFKQMQLNVLTTNTFMKPECSLTAEFKRNNTALKSEK